jgi:hypothetical protein
MVCSILLGKFLSVHMGMVFSGGSAEAEYDSVLWGKTTCVLALAPRVPDSRRGLP